MRLYVIFFLSLSNRHGEITVLYPSLADWSESPPYSALPRPGVEPLEKNRQLYPCVFHLASTPGRQVEHRAFAFCFNWGNNKVGRPAAGGSGGADRTEHRGGCVSLDGPAGRAEGGEQSSRPPDPDPDPLAPDAVSTLYGGPENEQKQGEVGSAICQVSPFPFPAQSVSLAPAEERGHRT